MLNTKSIIAAFLLLTAFGLTGYAQKTAEQNLDDIIKSENAFAKMATDLNVKKAFLANLDTASRIFNGPKSQNGFAVYSRAKENNNQLLTWYPAIARVASSGDIGFTSGPFSYKSKRTDTVSLDGYYFTVWKRDGNGVFKVMLDGGASHSAKYKPEVKLESAAGLKIKAYPANKLGVDFRPAVDAFYVAADADPAKAYQTYLTDKAYMVRNNMPAGNDKTTDIGLLQKEQAKGYHFTEDGYGLSQNKDMAYTYGQVNAQIGDNAKKSTGFYIRVWQFDGKAWKIIADEVTF